MNKHATSFEFSDGEIVIRLEQGAVHIKAVDKSGDPVELTKEEALEVAEALKNLAAEIAD